MTVSGRIRLVKFRPTISGSVHPRTVNMLLTEAGQSNGKFCPRSNWKLVQLIITKSLDRFKFIYSLKCWSFIHCRSLIGVNRWIVERGSSVGRMPDSQSREPGFESPLLPFQSLGIFFHFTTPQSTQLYK